MKTKVSYLKSELIENPNEKAWNELSQLVLAQMVTFNRKRVGETERLTVSTYNKKCNASMDSDVKKCLTPLEIKLAESLMRIETRGKRGRKVAILLTNDMQNSIDILNQFRNVANVPTENPFIFPMKSEEGHIRGSDALRNVAIKAKLKNRTLMTSTRLRKHAGTMSQVLNLSNHELDILANFLGHDIRVQR